MSGNGVVGSSDQTVGRPPAEVANRSAEPMHNMIRVPRGPGYDAQVYPQPLGVDPIMRELADRVSQAVQPGTPSEAWSFATGPSHQDTKTFPLGGRKAYAFDAGAKSQREA